MDTPSHSAPDAADRAGGPTMSRTTVVVAAAVTAVVAFVVGFGLAVSGDDDEGGDVAADVTTTTVDESSGTSVDTTVATVTVAPTIDTTPTTDAPPETAVPPPPPTEVIQDPPVTVTSPPSTAAPARLTAQYSHDSADRLIMNRGGTATLTLTNVGGSLGQWLVQASGYVFVEGVSSGTLLPGQSVQVRLRGAPDVPPVSPQGNITVSGGAGGQFTIDVLVL